MIIADIRANIHGWNSRERLGKQNASENAFGSLSCTVRKRYTRCHYWTQPANAPAIYLSETTSKLCIWRGYTRRHFLSTLTEEKNPWRIGLKRKKERKRIFARSESKYLDYIATMIPSVNPDVWWNEGEESGGWEPLWPHAHSSVAPIKRATLISTTRSDPAVISFSRAPAVYSALSLSLPSRLSSSHHCPPPVPPRFHSRSSARTRTNTTRAPTGDLASPHTSTHVAHAFLSLLISGRW